MYYPYSEETRDRCGMVMTSAYGPRSGRFHAGVDLAPTKEINTDIEIIATTPGQLLTGVDANGGKWTYIKGNNGKGFLALHHRKFLRTHGTVRAGEPIALMGTTGLSTGVHVHFEYRSKYWMTKGDVDPMNSDLTYYKNDMEDFIGWNDLIKEKGLTSEIVSVTGDQTASKIVNKMDGLNENQKTYLKMMYEMNQFVVEANKSPNKEDRLPQDWTATVDGRKALYTRRSTVV